MFLMLAGPSYAGSISGQVIMPTPVVGEKHTHPEQAVVWLEVIPEKLERELARGPKRGLFGKRHPPPTPELIQTNGHFEPRVVSVVAGRDVVLRNADRVWHGVFSVSKPGAFDLGKRAPGRVDTLQFDAPGVVALRCELHPSESAFVVVTPNHASVAANVNGEWRLPELPEGRYALRAWAPGREELRREVEIGKKSTVKLSLRW
jgi:hypothetical protein